MTPRRAAFAISFATIVITLGGAVMIRLFDPHDFPTLGVSFWWAAQTVTTVGYGDVVPHSTSGRVIAVVVMLTGIGFLTVVTASVTAALVEGFRREQEAKRGLSPAKLESSLADVNARLERIEAALSVRPE